VFNQLFLNDAFPRWKRRSTFWRFVVEPTIWSKGPFASTQFQVSTTNVTFYKESDNQCVIVRFVWMLQAIMLLE